MTAAAGPVVTTRQGFLDDALVSYGDLFPTLKLKWNSGVNNYLVYAAGDIPIGDYNPSNLANVGLGHGAVDLGGGYTYFNPTTGLELSSVAGLTYNFKNPDTQYQSGIDFHFDWGVSKFLSKEVFVGFVGYAYQQVTDDFGQPAVLGGFRSRVLGVGPQVGYVFPVANMQGFLGTQGLRRIRPGQQALGLEYVADVLDLGGSAKNRDAGEPPSDEVGSLARPSHPLFHRSELGDGRSRSDAAANAARALARVALKYCSRSR